jgi:ABC-type glycerol-3-phosphate transport system substrate-binding protein
MDFGPGYTAAINKDLAQWNGMHTGIAINWIWKSYSVIAASGKLALSGPGGPDIMMTVEGWPNVQMGAAGLFANLNKYATQYGWYKKLSASVIALNSSTSNGKYFGRGNLYSVSDSSTEVGYCYNKSLLTRLHLTLPATLSAFTQDMAVAKAHNIIPMEQGNLLHTWDSFMVSDMPTASILNWVFGNGNGTVNNAGEIAGAQTLLNWAKNGYFQPGFISESQNGGTAAPMNNFLAGKSLFYGSCDPTLYGNITAANKQNNVGFFIQPPLRAGGPIAMPGGANNPYIISARSSQKDAAAKFINFLLTKPAQERIQPYSALLPIDAHLGPNPSLPHSLIVQTLSSAYAKVVNGIVPWPDFATLDYVTVMTADTDELVSGKISPQAMMASLQQDHSKFLATLGR